MENQITLNVPSRKSANVVDFKGYKLYTEDGRTESNGLWLANISFTAETEEAGIELLTQLRNLGVLKSFISQDETVERIAPTATSIASAFANLAKK
jgi:hypothetical protein